MNSVPSIQLQIRGTLLVALSGILYGVLGYFGTLLLNENFSVTAMLFWRFFIAALWMLGGILLFKKNVPQSSQHQYTIIKMILLGIVTYCGSSVFYFMASQHIGTGVAMVIFFAYPVFVTLFAWFFTDWQMNKYAILSLIAVVLGLLFLKGEGDNSLNLMGITLGLIAATCYAIYVYGSRHSAKNIDSRWLTFFVCIGNAFIFFVLSIATHSFIFPNTLPTWFYAFALGVIATAVPIQLLLDGLKYISPIKASIISVLEPVVTVLVGLALLNETLSNSQILGILIVLLGAIFIQFEKVKNAEPITEDL